MWSRVSQELPLVATRILGIDSIVAGTDAGARDDWGFLSVHARSLTIAGGTTEVNKNIVAERVLGLPREPR